VSIIQNCSGRILTAIWLAKIKYRRGELLLQGDSPFSVFQRNRIQIRLSIKNPIKSNEIKHFGLKAARKILNNYLRIRKIDFVAIKIKKDTQQFQRIALVSILTDKFSLAALQLTRT
jgi:hypothetical protein